MASKPNPKNSIFLSNIHCEKNNPIRFLRPMNNLWTSIKIASKCLFRLKSDFMFRKIRGINPPPLHFSSYAIRIYNKRRLPAITTTTVRQRRAMDLLDFTYLDHRHQMQHYTPCHSVVKIRILDKITNIT